MDIKFKVRQPYLLMIYRIITLSLIGTIIGIVVALLAQVFLRTVRWMNDILLVSPSTRIQFDDELLILISATILVPTIGGLIVGLIFQYLVKAKRSLGPPDTILMVQTDSSGESMRSGIMSTIAATISLGVGASVGQYGPLVYLGTIVGAALGKLQISISNLQSICIASGVAAAIAAAFNAPIAGLVFAHEVILRHYSMQAFAPTAVAAAVAYTIVDIILEQPLLFSVQFEGVQYPYEYVFFGILGILCAFLAIAFAKGIMIATAHVQKSNIPIFVRPMIAGFILGIVAIKIPDVLGIGSTTLRFATIDHAFEVNELALILIAKFAVTILCISFGFAGGVFSPILLIGILFGALYESIIDLVVPLAITSVVPYAICGMMAAASPVIGAPLATILIVFELTHSYDLTIASMVAVVFSNLVAYRIFGRSMYDAQLFNRGFDLSLGRSHALAIYKKVSEIAHENFLALSPDENIGEAIDKLETGFHQTGIVVDEDDTFLGLVTLEKASDFDSDQPIDVAYESVPLTFSEETNVAQAVEACRFFNVDIVPVVESENQQLLGVVWPYDVMRTYLLNERRLQAEEHETL